MVSFCIRCGEQIVFSAKHYKGLGLVPIGRCDECGVFWDATLMERPVIPQDYEGGLIVPEDLNRAIRQKSEGFIMRGNHLVHTEA